ncbi:FAD-dependent oxidoreductase [Brachybacterium huguangmaarense]|uniref:FAD-dependent oxidoreductase n=1 Tax=Brachybacterium huguangmaarense TaxID=1652028 RepID=A0ABY6FY22_9MICO|nr:FAD-dependent oxidoreductase [Brachybacterium huguangmaarense]UYG15820.1 FAD-dependent oxidoreductase [Brachybacterium huguangmaarense]
MSRRTMTSVPRPGRDRRAVLHRAPAGAERAEGRRVVVIGGGIAGIAAATVLAERGVDVDLVEREHTWGGRARSWDLGDGRSMSRGFHAFFRQYYTLRALLRRGDPSGSALTGIGDYPLQLAGGPRDSFRGIPRTPPLSVAAFALRSRSFPVRQLARVDVPAALALLRADFPATFSRYDGVSAQTLLDELRFPHDARHLALEVFARSFFADPAEFSAGELVGMFHTYFMGSAEGLVFDVPVDAYSPALWDPLIAALCGHGARARTGTRVVAVRPAADAVHVTGETDDFEVDAVVIAADPRGARALLDTMPGPTRDSDAWRRRIRSQRNAPPFAVWRLWLDLPVAAAAPAFLGTSGYGPLDNVSVLERFEATAARWSAAHGGSVLELHAYALHEAEAQDPTALRRELWHQLLRLHPELARASAVHEEWIVHDDCPLIGTSPWAERPTVRSPDERVVLAGDWLRTDEPVALMERAALTGVQAANTLLSRWGVAGQDYWSVPLRGVLRGRGGTHGARRGRRQR